jgi:hypothetical protein
MVSYAKPTKMIDHKFRLGLLTVTLGVEEILYDICGGNDADFLRRFGRPSRNFDNIKHIFMPGDPIGDDIKALLRRHVSGDWGDLDPEDKARNDEAIAHEGDPDNQQRVLSAYELHGRKVWVITEWNRSETTVLLPSEY